jgi:DNA replication protein DnaC
MNKERLDAIKIPHTIAQVLLSSDYDGDREICRQARQHWDAGDPILVLTGQSRIGKSVAAAALAHDARTPGRTITAMVNCDEGEEGAYRACVEGVWYGYYVRDVKCQVGSIPISCMWVHAPSTFDRLFAAAWWKVFESVDMLVVDDLGLEVHDERVRDQLVGKLIGRFEGGLRTIVTTNLDWDAFRSRYCATAGQRLIARIGRGWIQVGKRKEQPCLV